MKTIRFGALVLALALPCTTHALVIDSIDWVQPVTTNSWTTSQVATHCDATTGVCHGSIGSNSLEGLVWASNDEVIAMVEALILPGTTQFSTVQLPSTYIFKGSDAIDLAIGDLGFYQTAIFDPLETVTGYTRTFSINAPSYYGAWLRNWFNPMTFDEVTVGVDETNAPLGGNPGFWLYHAPATVPLPAAGWLLLSGAGALAAFARRRRGARESAGC
jgi:hypothetical protein